MARCCCQSWVRTVVSLVSSLPFYECWQVTCAGRMAQGFAFAIGPAMQSIGTPANLPPTAGYLFTYWHTKVAEERKACIERVNEQLRELYGPLLACVTATESAYAALLSSTTEAGDVQSHRAAVQNDPNSFAAQSYRCASLGPRTVGCTWTVL